jgi:hypothetical protein
MGELGLAALGYMRAFCCKLPMTPSWPMASSEDGMPTLYVIVKSSRWPELCTLRSHNFKSESDV